MLSINIEAIIRAFHSPKIPPADNGNKIFPRIYYYGFPKTGKLSFAEGDRRF